VDEEQQLQIAFGHHQEGRLLEAAEAYRRVLWTKPDHPDALYLFGCLLQQTNNHLGARDVLRSAVAASPEQSEYHYALGLALSAMHDHEEAARVFERAVALDPQNADAFAALGRALRILDAKSKDAAAHLQRAFKLSPVDSALGCDLADSLLDLGRLSEAANTYQQVLNLDQNLARAWYGCGCAENTRQEYGAARDCFARAVLLEPDWLEARHNLGRALYELGRVSEAFEEFSPCAQMDRDGAEQSRAVMAVIAPGVLALDNAAVLAVRRNWAQRDIRVAASLHKQPNRHRPLRVGYVSSFFHCEHWMKPVWGLINQHDRGVVEVHLFGDGPLSRIQHGYSTRQEDRFFDTSQMSNGEVVALVEQCGIDVLVDLNGYSNMRRLPLFARHPAPATVGWFNMYATTGMHGFDFLIGDGVVMPADEEQFYLEKVLRVPGSYLTFEVGYPVPDVALSRTGPGNEVVFGSLASHYKISDEVMAAWCAILRTAPACKLLVKNKQMGTRSGREDFTRRLEAHGIALDRVELDGPEVHFDFLKAYERIDVVLDTFPYNGGTTTTEAIWQGVPVITFHGDRWASRTSASLLRAGGLGEFVASDVDGYVRLAVELAHGGDTRKLLGDLRRTMRSQLRASPVCDTRGFARHMEQLYSNCCALATRAEA
jgi:protein O-GlcNAc transferase